MQVEVYSNPKNNEGNKLKMRQKGFHHSPATKEKMRKRMLNNKINLGRKLKLSPEEKERRRLQIMKYQFVKGRKLPPEEIEKIRFRMTNRIVSPETREKLKQINLGNTNRLGYKCSEATKQKHRGENSHFWRGGITQLYVLLRTISIYAEWRDAVFIRDNYTCQNCGRSRCVFHAHHIKSFAQIIRDNKIETFEQAMDCKELWMVNNGMTLCIPCHKLTETYASKMKRIL